MPHRPAALAALCCLVVPAPFASAGAQDSSVTSPAPLFRADAPLELRLETDLRTLLRDRGEERAEYGATLRYASAAGDTGVVDVELRTRGIFRLKRCSFPPLRLDLPRSRVEGTPFAGQDKLKLVTHCRDGRGYEQNVLQEYALYRAFNVLTDRGFRVRPVRATYIDTTRGDSLTRPAFLIESEEELAARLGASPIAAANVHDLLIDDTDMTLVAVFQYLIGNTDWSVWGLHNITILRDTAGTLLAIPYDFDFSGAVAAPYATPPPQLPIRSVRERLYRGYCRPDSLLAAVLTRFREAKDSIYAVVRAVPDLDPRDAKSVLDYFDGFFRTIENPGTVRREFVHRCRQLPG